MLTVLQYYVSCCQEKNIMNYLYFLPTCVDQHWTERPGLGVCTLVRTLSSHTFGKHYTTVNKSCEVWYILRLVVYCTLYYYCSDMPTVSVLLSPHVIVVSQTWKDCVEYSSHVRQHNAPRQHNELSQPGYSCALYQII